MKPTNCQLHTLADVKPARSSGTISLTGTYNWQAPLDLCMLVIDKNSLNCESVQDVPYDDSDKTTSAICSVATHRLSSTAQIGKSSFRHSSSEENRLSMILPWHSATCNFNQPMVNEQSGTVTAISVPCSDRKG